MMCHEVPGRNGPFLKALEAHDARIREYEMEVWVGGEPTFTDRFSTAPEWGTSAHGHDKLARALDILRGLGETAPGSAVLRTIGRQYPGEERPRFSLGIYARRDRNPVWAGPSDPLQRKPTSSYEDLFSLRQEIGRRLEELGYHHIAFEADDPLRSRLLFSRRPINSLDAGDRNGPARPSVHAKNTGMDGPADTLAAQGLFLLSFGLQVEGEFHLPRLELPMIQDVDAYQQLLAIIAAAACELHVPSMVLAGFGPPIDHRVSFTTITPDPGVLEFNMAPSRDCVHFYGEMVRAYEQAHRVGLSAHRLYFNGEISDSGGGGHLTLGGTSPRESPFFLNPKLLPRLLCYLVSHPSLSYYFSQHSGSSSQAPRVDEGSRDSFEELALAVFRIQLQEHPSPELIWKSFAPFLTDRFGNTHRTELNVEKLWNPYLPGRGKLGLVELRAFRMPNRPEHWAALGALFRSLIAFLSRRPEEVSLTDWKDELHDRFSLPFFLRQDLHQVFSDLEEQGLLPEKPIIDEIESDEYHLLATATLGKVVLSLRKAIEFWPVVGDLSDQNGTSRIMDSSCSRLEISLRGLDVKDDHMEGWWLAIGGYREPLRVERDKFGAIALLGLRYRTFVPNTGMHPLVPAQDVLDIMVGHQEAGAWRIAYHNWKPEGGTYAGLPQSVTEADRRRQERLIITALPGFSFATLPPAPKVARSTYCLDTRFFL